jgi:hypothetical protein
MLNWSKIIGFSLIAMAMYEMMKLIVAYASGKMEFWPSGVEIGAALIIALGVFLVRRGNRSKSL